MRAIAVGDSDVVAERPPTVPRRRRRSEGIEVRPDPRTHQLFFFRAQLPRPRRQAIHQPRFQTTKPFEFYPHIHLQASAPPAYAPGRLPAPAAHTAPPA